VIDLKKNYVTIKTLAKELGMSVSTISRALNDKPDISEETKKKILETAKELGYVRNVTATMMRSNKSLTVGVIFEAEFDPFFSEILQGIEKGISKHDYRMLLMNTELRNEESKTAMNTLMEHRVDGVIIVPSSSEIEYIKPFIEDKFPVVIIGRDYDDINVDEVYTDDVKGGYLAAEHLLKKGRRRLLMINSCSDHSAARMRQTGFSDYLEKSDIKSEYRIINDIETDYENTISFVKREYESGVKYDGVFCFNDMRAFAVINALSEKGIRVPEDVSVIGYDNIEFTTIFSPDLTTINIDKEKAGNEAVKILIQKINGTRKRTKKLMLDVSLIERET